MVQQRASMMPYRVHPIQDILSRTARILPSKVAVIEQDRRFTFRQLDQYSSRFAAALAVLGISKGDRVGIMAPNCTEFEIAFFGITRAGAVATTINSSYQEREIAHQVNDSGAETVIVHESLLGMMNNARDAIPGLQNLIVIQDSSRDPNSFWGKPPPNRSRPTS